MNYQRLIKTKINLLFSSLIIFASIKSRAGELTSLMYINSEETQVTVANQPFSLLLDIFDKDAPDAMKHFHPMHEKKLHLIIVSEDLKTFAHVHPTHLKEHHGLFRIRLNEPNTDPDNQDTASALSLPGRYYLFAETMMMGFSMTTLPFDLTAEGPPRTLETLTEDPMNEKGEIIKIENGFKIRFKPSPYYHCNSLSVMLEVFIQKWDENEKVYKDLIDIEPWLSAFAHAVMISDEGKTAKEKAFYHFHTVWPLSDDPESERGPDLRMGLDNHNPIKQGLYKTWLQFKQGGVIRNFSFNLKIKEPLKPSISTPVPMLKNVSSCR